MTDKPRQKPIRNLSEYLGPLDDGKPLTCDSRLDEIGKAMAHDILDVPCTLEPFLEEHCLTSRCLTEKGKAILRPRSLNVDFEGIMPGIDQDIYDINNRKALAAQLGPDPEPEIRGETTFGLNPKWIDWYCRVNHTAVWKARKAGKEKLRKLQALVNRFNK